MLKTLVLCLWLLSPALAIIAESDLQSFLQSQTSSLFPPLQAISQDLWDHPQISLQETRAHDEITAFFEARAASEGWNVTRHAWGEPTGFEISWTHRPAGAPATLPVIGFLAEYDSLVGIGPACGHNLIALNGLYAASLAREAVLHYDLTAQIRIIGTPDEEFTGGKIRMSQRGAFDIGDVYLMAHPTVTNAVQPMGARHTALLHITGTTHFDTIFKAYQALLAIEDLGGHLPGTASTAAPTEDVGLFESNVVQTEIKLGVLGDLNIVNASVAQAKASVAALAAVNWTATATVNGVVLDFQGPGGHSAEGTLGALTLSIETFRILSKSQPWYKYFLPSNTSVDALDISVSIRSRFTSDMPAVEAAVLSATAAFVTRVEFDTLYLALEVSPYLGQRASAIMGEPLFNESFPIATTAPAATDAAWIQQPVLDPTTHALLAERVPVLHANYGICPDARGAGCAFNHEAGFAPLANTDLAYAQTEKVARIEAQIALELIDDPAKMAQARALVKH